MAITQPFLFMRHGRTAWNADGRAQGALETRLNGEGRAQVERAARALASEPIARIVASPLMRVHDTAERVAAFHRLEVDYDPDLGECRLGAGQGLERGLWLKDYWAGRETPEGAETFEAFAERAFSALGRAVDRPNVLVIAHGGIWRGLRAYVRIEPEFWIANAAPVRVAPARGVWRVAALPGFDAAGEGETV